ncbi:carbohydrate ABC transporter membrane protein 1, CUT1 family [Nitratireductor aquibiodomus]|uniref:sn-glycerol-3-phosphate transport system permease protein UgpA n=1 Tax=Nitratireductor aquibiodomus TaxID=204799 RepID=A0A1H4Q2I2_9HYPH|nr:ABC transporter permease subunit [Nitratireductor aquibiodomus]SEC13720.1 carbohydrate ABC transporter membrane protein 1, CUT1 family [Nitratireductor aquibiodomus]
MQKRAYFKANWLAYLFIAPQLLIIFVFFYWPASQAMYWAFTLEQPFGGGNQWVGLDNFKAVFSDETYWASIWRSIVFAVLSTGLAMSLALVLALFADRQLRGYRFFRVGMIWPYAIAAPAAALAFRFLFNPQSGVFAYLNTLSPGLWNPALSGVDAMTAIIITQAWKQVSYSFIFFLAGLQSIPRSLIEAGSMDGARVMRRMVDLQLPLLAPNIFFLLVINMTDSFTDSFGIVDILTEGGPARATELMVYKIYVDGFQGLDYSGAAAQSLVLMGLVILMTFFQFRFIERRVHYT